MLAPQQRSKSSITSDGSFRKETPKPKTVTRVEQVESTWGLICEYFVNVQCAETEQDLQKLNDQLGDLEVMFDTILHLLRKERYEWLASDGGEGLIACKVEYGSKRYALPPCYALLFSETNVEASPFGDDELTETHHPSTATTFSPIGDTFLMLLCQFAKQNEPLGVRRIILQFLCHVLHEADLPTKRRSDSEPPCSLLQLYPQSSIVPLLDMVRQVGDELNPDTLTSPVDPDPGSSQRAVERKESDNEAERTKGRNNNAEQTAFVCFLCALSERVECVPDLANFFIADKPSTVDGDAVGGTADTALPTSTVSSAHRREKEKSVEQFVLLEQLLPYLTHNSASPGWKHRGDTCCYALGAVTSLAKCPDPWVQDLVSQQRGIVAKTLHGACMTLLTLCKIPGNDDSNLQLLYLRDLVRFWSTLSFTAPRVAAALQLEEQVERDFIKGTVLPLFATYDRHVYASVCLVVAALLQELGRPDFSMSRLLVQHVLTAPAAKGQAGTLFEAHVLPHLRGSPQLSKEDEAIRTAMEYYLTEWTTLEATLSLLRALIISSPDLFMQHALHIGPIERGQFLPHNQPDDSFPTVHLPNCFSPKLHVPSVPLLQRAAEEIAEDVMKVLLLVEGNTSMRALDDRLLGFNRFLAGQEGAAAPERAKVDQSTQSQANRWICKPLHECELVVRLCKVMGDGLFLPPRVLTQLHGVFVALCVLPDIRVLFTLMDAEYGRLDHELQKIRAMLDGEFEEDEKVQYAAAVAAAMVAGETKTAVSAKALKAGNADDTSTSPTAVSQRRLQAVNLVTDIVSTTSTLFTREYLYRQYIQFYDVFHPNEVEETNHAQGLSVELLTSIMNHQAFLERCVQIELFRLELDAVVSHMTFSHTLLSLKPF